MLSSLYKYMLVVGAIASPPVNRQEAVDRYGPLHGYHLLNKDILTEFDFNVYGLPYKGQVNKDIVVPLHLVMDSLEQQGLIGEIKSFAGCYSPRAIRGTNRISIHAFGLGCDFNAYLPARFSYQFVQTWKRYGFCWGGDFTKRDTMHFSYAKFECTGLWLRNK